ncbi:type II and III secretion system protein family protein [Limnoglobus roseus]|uniref:Secretion system protein n=1 Tax=Limnoglobus roseus TaxID=2598579 RepID=A0A5C1A807_9BACT|nr:pilus assembly protein N-terminal domain-containing protein [Limnoglobus roseus]QEL14377.1 secretion system protein [Limnoglobus roseus]
MGPAEPNGLQDDRQRKRPLTRAMLAVPVVMGLFAVTWSGNPSPAQNPAAPMPPAVVPTTPAPAPSINPVLSSPLLSPTPKTIGTTPVISAESKQKQGKHVAKLIDPELTLDLVSGQTRVMVLKNTPFRVQAGDERYMTLSVINTKELILQGKDVGTTVLNIWFGDKDDPAKQETLTYLVRIYPDPEAKERLEKSYKQLEDDINKHFKDTSVRLKLLGDKLVVSGRVRDAQQGLQVLQIIRANFAGQGGGGSGNRPGLGGATNAGASSTAAQATQIPFGETVAIDPITGLASPTAENYITTAGNNNIINLLEVAGEQQVALRVIVAEVSRAAARSIGLNFSVTNKQGVTVFSNNNGSTSAGGGGIGNGNGFGGGNGINGGGGLGGALSGTAANITAVFDGGNIPVALTALRTLSYAKSLAEPTLVTLNGQTANFLAGGQFPVPIVTGLGNNNGLQGVSFVPFGVQLSFTPFITDRDRIRLQLSANVSTRDVSVGTSIGGSSVSGLNSRSVNTVVELRQGETLAVAGLIESNQGADASRTPLLGDVPFFTPFTSNRQSAGEKELVIFITPELVRPLEVGECPPIPGADIVEPTDIEFYLLNRLEGRVGPYRSVIRTDWGRIRQFEKVERAMLCGPSGYCPAP